MKNEMTNKQLALERLHRNGVLSPFPSVEKCVGNLAGIQAQVQQFSELAVLNRCSGYLSMKTLSSAYASHDFISLWGQRNTLHMYAAQDWGMICDIYHNRTYFQRYLPSCREFLENLSEQIRAMASKEKLVERGRIHECIQASSPPELKKIDWLTYMMLNHLCANGLLFGIPAKPSIKNFVFFDALLQTAWRENPERFAASLDDMLLRYFQYYGPATLQDFCHWSGLTTSIARQSLARVESRLNAATLEKRFYYTYGKKEVKNTRALSLLGKFDPLLVAYHDKNWIATPEQQRKIWRKAGHVEAVVLEGSTLIATWRHSLKGKALTICIEALTGISDAVKDRIQAKCKKLAQFWKKDLVAVVYME